MRAPEGLKARKGTWGTWATWVLLGLGVLLARMAYQANQASRDIQENLWVKFFSEPSGKLNHLKIGWKMQSVISCLDRERWVREERGCSGERVWAAWRQRAECWGDSVNRQTYSITHWACFPSPRVDSAESKCNCVLQGKPPSDEHLLKLCTDVLRSKYLFVWRHFTEKHGWKEYKVNVCFFCISSPLMDL